ncbi:MAG: O-antigen ligase family protein [Colwellia sp.]
MLINQKPFIVPFTFIYFFSLFGGVASLVGGEGNSSVYAVFWVVLYLFTIAFMMCSSIGFRIYKYELPVLLFCIYVSISFLWSEIPASSVKYSLSVVFNILFALLCSRWFSVNEFFILLLKYLNVFILLGLSLAAVGVDSAFYVDPLNRPNLLGTPLIQGLFSHKIYAGVYSAIALFWNLYYQKGYLRVFFVGSSLLLVLLSGSSLGLLVLFVGMLIKTMLYIFKKKEVRTLYLAPSLILFIFLLVIAFVGLPIVMGLLGRDLTFTGRSGLWEWGIHFFNEKPWLGWGYAGIFSDAVNAPENMINDSEYYKAPHFHNAYLQVLAELGIVGFIFIYFNLLISLKVTWSNYWSGKEDYFAPLIFLLVILLVGFGMNIMFRYNELTTVVVFFVFLQINKTLINRDATYKSKSLC